MTAIHPLSCTTPAADESAAILTARLRAEEPFFFIRYGDGALECIYGGGKGRTCDGEPYSPDLASELAAVWRDVAASPQALIGDWRTASFDAISRHTVYTREYAQLIQGVDPTYLHFEALLLMRTSPALVEFYRAVKIDPRRKVLMAPLCMRPAAVALGARHVVTPMHDLFAGRGGVEKDLTREDFDVLLYGAGMAGHIPAVNAWRQRPGRTCINIGSALDPLYRGHTRRQQLSPVVAARLFRGVLG